MTLAMLQTIAAAKETAKATAEKAVAEAPFSYDFNSSKQGLEIFNECMTDLVDAANVAMNDAAYRSGRGKGSSDVAFNRIGAGYIGLDCERAVGFRFHKFKAGKAEGEKVFVTKGELGRHARAGHWTEEDVVTEMRAAGFTVHTNEIGPDGQPLIGYDGKPKQIGWMALPNSQGKNQVAGEVDGVITAVPARVPDQYAATLDTIRRFLPVPCIFESKKATDKKWKKFKKEKVKKADPKYFGQVQMNMNAMQIPFTLFYMRNLDNMKPYWEVIPYDEVFTTKMIDRAIKITRSGDPFELLPIHHNPESWHGCMFCDHKPHCVAGKRVEI